MSRRAFFPGASLRTAFYMSLLSMAACSSQDCSCDGFEARPFPPQHYDKTVPRTMQVRVSSEGLGFVEDNIEPLVEGALPDGLNFCLPKDTDGDTKLCFPYVRGRSGYHNEGDQPMCSGGIEGCEINLEIEQTTITPVPSNGLDIQVAIGGLNATIPFEARDPLFNSRVTCDVTPYADGGDINDPATVVATVPVRFTVDSMSPTQNMRINVEEVGINLNQLDFDLKGGGICTTADFLRGLIRGTLEDQIRDQLRDTINSTVRENLCLSCETESCPGNAMCASDGICEYGNGECVPAPFGAEGALELGQTIGDFSETPDAKVDSFIKLADYANVDTGLTLGIRSGFQPEVLSDCIPIDPTTRPAFNAVPISPTLVGDVRPGTNNPFHLGIGVYRGMIEHVLWSAWASGATCLKVDSKSTAQLSTAALGIFVRSLTNLTDDDNRQAELKIVPQKAPKIILGQNTVMETDEGYVVEDGLFTIDWKDLDLHIYAWVQDRWTRVATVRIDLLLPVAVVPDGAGNVEAVLGDVEKALTNLRGLNGELLEEDPDALAEVIPSLVGLALPSLADSLNLAFELPEFFGLRIVLNQGDITSVDGGQYIALFANLEATGMQPTSDKVLPTPAIDHVEVVYPEGATKQDYVRPEVKMSLSASLFGAGRELVAGEDVEFAWRVDGGFWSMYSKLSDVVVRDPLLALPGEHTIEVKARVAKSNVLVNREQLARTDVRIDYQAPSLELERVQGRLSFNASDLTDRANDMRYRYKIHDGESASQWSAWSVEQELDLDALEMTRDFRVEVEVKDRQGLTTRDSYTVRGVTPSATPDAPQPAEAESSSSCSQVAMGGKQSPPFGALALLGVLFGMVGVSRKRKHFRQMIAGALAVLGMGAVSSGCSGCGEEAPSTNSDDPLACATPCEDGFVCKQAQCVEDDPTPCQSDAECDDAQRCEAGICVEPECREDVDCGDVCDVSQQGTCLNDNTCMCEDYCADGCGDEQFCCFAQNACLDNPDPCDGTVCDPGFVPGNPVLGEVNQETCMVKGSTCECIQADPLPLGEHGRYSSMARTQDGLVIATYNETYGDLMVGLVDESDYAVAWEFVDGVPTDGDVTGALDGPRGGVKVKGPKVGAHTAIVADEQGNVHVFYQDLSNKALRYARGVRQGEGFDWSFTTIADDAGEGGLFNKALFADGKIHLVTLVDNVELEADNQRFSELRYMTLDPAASLDSISFEGAQVIVSGAASKPCKERCQGDAVCVRSTGECVVPETTCAAGCTDGYACSGGACMETYDSAVPVGTPVMVGAYPDMTKTADGVLVTFYDGLQKNVGWSQSDASGAWSMPQYLASGTGPYSSAVLGEDGTLHVAYMQDDAFSLLYESVNAQGVSSNPEIIMRGLRDTGSEWLVSRIGEDVQIQLDVSNQPEVVFQDATLHRLMHVRRNGSGAWMSTVLSQKTEPFDGSHGFYPELLRQGSTSLVVEYVINKQTDPTTAYPAIYPLP